MTRSKQSEVGPQLQFAKHLQWLPVYWQQKVHDRQDRSQCQHQQKTSGQYLSQNGSQKIRQSNKSKQRLAAGGTMARVHVAPKRWYRSTIWHVNLRLVPRAEYQCELQNKFGQKVGQPGQSVSYIATLQRYIQTKGVKKMEAKKCDTVYNRSQIGKSMDVANRKTVRQNEWSSRKQMNGNKSIVTAMHRIQNKTKYVY